MSDRQAPMSAIWGLGVTQIVGYGTLFYSYSILAPSVAAEHGHRIDDAGSARRPALHRLPARLQLHVEERDRERTLALKTSDRVARRQRHRRAQ